MNETFKAILAEAMHLGRPGCYTEATALSQRGLHLMRNTAKPDAAADRRGVIDGDDEAIEDVGPMGGCLLHGRLPAGRRRGCPSDPLQPARR
ncbi:MAG: hypothetical protein ACUVT0_07525 [Thermochromatium sp.]